MDRLFLSSNNSQVSADEGRDGYSAGLPIIVYTISCGQMTLCRTEESVVLILHDFTAFFQVAGVSSSPDTESLSEVMRSITGAPLPQLATLARTASGPGALLPWLCLP